HHRRLPSFPTRRSSDLKQINDRFGHSAGSQAIIKTGEILRGVFRDSDIIARLGGDEFVVLMINPSADSDRIVSARLQEKIDNFKDRKSTRLNSSHQIIS